MDRSWILHYQNRFSAEYIAGVNSFIDFAKANSGGAVLIKCPCNDCCNHRKHDYVTVRKHLHIQGMMVSYLRWIYHGEPIVQLDDSDESEDESEENQDAYEELIEDHCRGTYLEEDTQERDDVQDFENLLKASAKGINEKGKRNVSGNDKDENYIPPKDDDVDEETSWSQLDEIANMPRDNRVKRARTIAAALNSVGVESTHEALPTSQPLPTQPQPSQLLPSPHTVGSSVASAPSSSQPSRVRGVT